MNDIKFTVHVPVYNVEKYVSRCIESILNQTYTNFELILTDDGSTDKSGSICDEYAKKDGRIKVFHNENMGLLLTRRFSVSKATGDFSVFVDSDDYVADGLLKTLVMVIEEQSPDIIIYNWKYVTENRKTESTPVWDNKIIFDINQNKNKLIRSFLFSMRLNSMCFKAIKTDILQSDPLDYGQYEYVKYAEDFLQSLYPIVRADKIVYIPDALYYYYQNKKSVTHTFNTDDFKSVLTARAIGYEYIKQYELLNDKGKAEYKDYMMSALTFFAEKVAVSDIGRLRKHRVFDDMLNHEFYKAELEGNVRLDFESRLLTKGKYDAFICIIKIKNAIKNILRPLKRFIIRA